METKEGLTRVLMQEAEAGVLKLLERLHRLQEGDLKGLEQQVMETIFEIGRGWMQGVLSEAAPEEQAPGERVGSCGHQQQLVGYRPKQVLTLLGKITFKRAYYQCVVEEERVQASMQEGCTHGEAPADQLWGVQGRRTSAGVQQAVSYLCASATLEEAAAPCSRLLPLQMSAHQALNLLQPLGEALQQQEDEQVRALWDQASQARTTSQPASASQQESIDRLYIELDGVLARLRRGSVPMEEQERKRKGDVYREVKVGAVFEATRGPERSGLAPGVFVDQAGPQHYVARRAKAEDFGKLLYTLAVSSGLHGAHHWWSWGMEPPGSGDWWPNTFPGPCKSWTCGMHANMSGRWPARSLAQTRRRPAPGPSTPAVCWQRARSRTSSRRSSSYRQSRRSRGLPQPARHRTGLLH